MKHNKPIQRVLSLLLAFVLLIVLLPAGAIAKAAETSPDLEPQETAYVQSDEASEEAEENGGQLDHNFSEATEEPLATTETEPTEATTIVSTEPAETDPEVPAPIEPTEETEAPEITEPEETEPETTEAEEEPTETGVEAIIANAVTLTEASARAANTLTMWGEYVFNYDRTYTFGTSYHTDGIRRLYVGSTDAFCIEPTKEAAANTNYTNAGTAYAINKLGAEKFNAISLAMYYGYPNTNYGTVGGGASAAMGGNVGNWQRSEKLAATQVIIWEIALGYRSAIPPYRCTNSRLYDLSCKTKNGYYSWTEFQNVYKQISDKMAKHDAIPSFANRSSGKAPTYELKYDSASGNYKLSLTDSNKILSDFTMPSISGITMSVSGNTLTITATPAAVAQLQNGVSCKLASKTRKEIDPSKVVAVWGHGNDQAVITPISGRLDPAPAYFKLKAAAASTAKVVKKNSEAGGRVANFTFQLTDASGVVYETKQTDANGNITFTSNLIIGKSYTIHEVPAAGFVPQRDQYFVAKAGDNIVEFTNTRIYGNVQVTKTDADTGVHLSGATFKIYQDSNGNGVLDDIDLVSATTMKTDSSNPGVYYFNHLPYGKYHLRETQAPDGYTLDETVYNFSITEDGKTVIVSNHSGSGNFTNEKKTGSVMVLKVDKEYPDHKLTGATFMVYEDTNGNGELDGTEAQTGAALTGNASGEYRKDGLVCGKYILQETKAPEGYLLDSSVYPFEITKGGEVVTVETEAGTGCFINQKIYGNVKVLKVDKETGETLTGASFMVYEDTNGNGKLDGTEAETGVALSENAKGEYIKNHIPYGKYLLRETEAPEGYLLDAAVYPFEITENGKTVMVETAVGTGSFANQKIYGNVTVLKVDKEYPDHKLTGAVFTVYKDSNGNGKLDGQEADTAKIMTETETGVYSLTHISYGKYLMKETQAPEGYVLDNAYYPFAIVEDGKTVTVETEAGTGCFINQKIYGNVQTTKVDEQYPENRLTGAVFTVYEDTNSNGKLDDNESATAKTMTETETGVYSLTHIPYGAYLMKETQAPENYVLDENVYSFSIVEDGKTVIVENQAGTGCFINQPMGYIAIQKNTVNTEDNISKPEQNAEFQVFLTSAGSYDQADDAHRDLLVTDKNGFAVSKILPAGTYTVHQVKGTDGTKLAEDFTVEVKDAGKTYSYALNNEYFLASLKLLKHEKNTDILLEGATYGLYDGEQNLLETGVTEEDGSLTFAHHLVYGLNYFIREEEAPLGYECDTEFKPVPTPDWTNGATEIPVLVMELEDKPQEGRIQVNKVDTGRNPMDGVSFLLEYSTDGKSWNPVFFREGEDVVVGGCTSEGLEDGVLKTDLDGTLTFTGLRLTCQTGEVHYRLTEVATKAGNTLLSVPAFEGTLPQERDAEGAENATEVRDGVAYYNDITVTVVNNPNYEIPMTGGTNAILLPLTGVLILLCGITVAFFATKKRKA